MKLIPDIIHNSDVQHNKYVKPTTTPVTYGGGGFNHPNNRNRTRGFRASSHVPSQFQIGNRATGYFEHGGFLNGKIIDICRNSFPPRYKFAVDGGTVRWTEEVYPPD